MDKNDLLTILSLVLSFAFGVVQFLFKQTLSDKGRQIHEMSSAIKETKDRLMSVEIDMASHKGKIEEIFRYIEKIDDNINKLNNKFDKLIDKFNEKG